MIKILNYIKIIIIDILKYNNSIYLNLFNYLNRNDILITRGIESSDARFLRYIAVNINFLNFKDFLRLVYIILLFNIIF